METIRYIDRETKQICQEKVYGARGIDFLYGKTALSRSFGRVLQTCISKVPWFSHLYGAWQHRSKSIKQIAPFIKAYGICTDDFLLPVEQFGSFNDFFIRKLKPEARPIAPGNEIAVMPADARYFCVSDLNQLDHFFVKGQSFNLPSLLQDQALADRYQHGTMVMARLCPVDYHRFHFPCACVPEPPRLIKGALYSVNPVATKSRMSIFWQNKRAVTLLQTSHFGQIAYIEIGATSVGSIVQTFTPGKVQEKGSEKGYFSFGASSLILLFEPGKITLEADLLEASAQGLEILCKVGQPLGTAKKRKNF